MAWPVCAAYSQSLHKGRFVKSAAVTAYARITRPLQFGHQPPVQLLLRGDKRTDRRRS